MQIIIYSKYFCFCLAKISGISHCRPNLAEFCDMLTAPARKSPETQENPLAPVFPGFFMLFLPLKSLERHVNSWLSWKTWSCIPKKSLESQEVTLGESLEFDHNRKNKKSQESQEPKISWLSRKGLSNIPLYTRVRAKNIVQDIETFLFANFRFLQDAKYIHLDI